ncbi:MAG: protein kinase domain-containing protein [Lachnospiraceae bacterium]
MRTALQPGSRLTLGGVEYTIEAVEGSGSSAVVYRAAYEDALNRGALHRVLIKELFPLSAQGGIERAPDGGVVCTGPGLAVMEEAKRRFLMGNQVNLELLAGRPEATAGNLNSFDARGTYYSVLSLHGGESLLRALDSARALPLREAAGVMLRLLGALAVFHRRGLLHLDVSPDNILLLPGQALLIDFNSVWDTRRPDWGDFCFSCKPGYSAPEVLLGDEAALCPATDIYSCGAVFFHLLSGRRLREGEAASGGFRRGLAGLPCLAGVPQSAASKAAEILLRALHALPRRRYA